jgi:hypothetical protein
MLSRGGMRHARRSRSGGPVSILSRVDQRHERRPLLGAFGVAVLATALFAAWLASGIGGETSVRYVDDLGTALAALAATALCLRAAGRQLRQLRAFWWLLGAACGAWTLGEAIWAVYDLVLHQAVPVPSWADVGYLTGIPLAVCALLSHPGMRSSRARKARSILDGLLVATALLFLSWTFVLGPLWQSTDLTTVGGLVTLAYPFGDVVIVFFIVLVVRRMTSERRLALWWLLGGLLAMALADSTYAYLTEVKSYATGNLIDTGWFAGYLAIALGAFCSDARGTVARRAEASLPTLAPIVAPFVPLLVALSVVGIEIQLGHRPDPVALIMAFGLVALVPVRQGLLMLDLMAPNGERTGGLGMRLHAALLGAIPENVPVESSPPPRPDRSRL